MGEHNKDQIEALVCKWAVPHRQFTYTQLTARTIHAGLAMPLTDLFKMNIATLLAGQTDLVKPPALTPPLTTLSGDRTSYDIE